MSKHSTIPGPKTEGRANADLSAKAVITFYILCAQAASVQRVVRMIYAAGEWPWLIIAQSWDEALMLLTFGTLCYRTLSTWATERWKRLLERGSITEEEYRRRIKFMKSKSAASFQVLVHRLYLRWGAGINEAEEIMVPPVAVQATTASNLTEGLNRHVPFLSGDSFDVLCSCVKIVLKCVTPDGASGNVRLVKDSAKLLPRNVAMFLWLCSLHGATKAPQYFLKTLGLLSPWFSMQKLLHVGGNFEEIVRALTQLATFELEVVPAQPDPAWGDHTRRVLNRTLDRFVNVRGRQYAKDCEPRRGRVFVLERLQRVSMRVRTVLNGNWARARFAHFCEDPECEHVREVTEALTDALQEMFPSGEVQENKWASQNAIRTFMAFLYECHGGSRSVGIAWGGGSVGDVAKSKHQTKKECCGGC